LAGIGGGDSKPGAIVGDATPAAVLEFWFGGAFGTPEMDEQAIGRCMPLWFGFNPAEKRKNTSEEQAALDEECRNRFGELVRTCSRGELDSLPEWLTPSGLFARMVLCDQIPRNAYRGTSEAFAYDEQAVAYARQIYEQEHYKEYQLGQWLFLCTPGEHSENPADHEMNMAFVAFAEEKFEEQLSGKGFMAKKAVLDHKVVIDRFGRFPHRNAALGRESTLEEEAWLADVENLPPWAKRS